jgi:hypothetical protein
MLYTLAQIEATWGEAIVMCVGFLGGIVPAIRGRLAQRGGNSGNSRRDCSECLEPWGIARYHKV